MKKLIAMVILTSSFVIAGCHGSGGDNNPPSVVKSPLTKLATQGLDSEPGEIADAAGLKADIMTLFGPADDDPVAINAGDDIQAVLDRASGR